MGHPIEGSFTVEEYEPEAMPLGPFTVRHCQVPHYISTWACEISGPEGGRFTFGADCAPNPELGVSPTMRTF